MIILTIGQLLFYSGLGLLALTVLLAGFFAVKKTQYKPENEVYAVSGDTQRLRNGYPTDPLTVRRKKPVEPEFSARSEQMIPGVQTEKLEDTGTAILDHSTVKLEIGTEDVVEDKTESLDQKTEHLLQKTMPLPEQGTVELPHRKTL